MRNYKDIYMYKWLAAQPYSPLVTLMTADYLLTAKDLPGMPIEYHPYVYLFEEESISGYAKSIAEVMSLSDEALNNKGAEAKQFVLKNKNEVNQGRRILELLS